VGYAFNTAWRGGKGDATLTFEDFEGLTPIANWV